MIIVSNKEPFSKIWRTKKDANTNPLQIYKDLELQLIRHYFGIQYKTIRTECAKQEACVWGIWEYEAVHMKC